MTMAKKKINTSIDSKLLERTDAAAQALEMGRGTYIEHALEAKIENLKEDRALAWERDKAYETRDTANAAATEANQQRDHFKVKMEAAVENLAVADAKLQVYKKRGWLARLFGWRPKPAETENMTLESLIRFRSRLETVGMTPKQIDQILMPLYHTAGVALVNDKVIHQIADDADTQG